MAFRTQDSDRARKAFEKRLRNRLTASQAARFIGVSRMTIYRWVEDGQIRSEETPLGLLVFKSDCEKLKKERS